jgi:mono/diheme cytochrome c family protein
MSTIRLYAYVALALPMFFASGAATSTADASTAPLATTKADSSTDESVAAGKILYNSIGCWSCHGFSGQGAMSRGIASGPHIDAKIFPREAFLRQLRTPASLMPPYSKAVLSDEQANEIYAFLRSIPAPSPVQDIPLLQLPK